MPVPVKIVKFAFPAVSGILSSVVLVGVSAGSRPDPTVMKYGGVPQTACRGEKRNFSIINIGSGKISAANYYVDSPF